MSLVISLLIAGNIVLAICLFQTWRGLLFWRAKFEWAIQQAYIVPAVKAMADKMDNEILSATGSQPAEKK